MEDNAFSIVPIQSTLQRHRVDYDIAKNGFMAVDRHNQMQSEGLKYGIILMDLEMPMMDGYEATEKIRIAEKSGKLSRTYICGLSASNDKMTQKACIDCGMDNYMSKPVNMEQMMKLISEQFDLANNK